MNQKEFEKETHHIIDGCLRVLTAGSTEYAGDNDKLANFKNCAELIGVSPQQVAFIYFYKHVAGIAKYCRDGKPQRDSFQGRIIDGINYLFLLNAILSESPPKPNTGNGSALEDARVFGQHESLKPVISGLYGSNAR